MQNPKQEKSLSLGKFLPVFQVGFGTLMVGFFVLWGSI